jgi:hypothetical protein
MKKIILPQVVEQHFQPFYSISLSIIWTCYVNRIKFRSYHSKGNKKFRPGPGGSCLSIILTTQEAEIRRISVQSKQFTRPYLEKYPSQKS